MPQWRKLYVKATESFDINAMPDDFTRFLWVMLPLGLDREGRGVDIASWIRSKIMPLRNDVTLEQIEVAMTWYADRGMIERYIVDDCPYFQVLSFREHQGNTFKEAPSRIPPPGGGGPEEQIARDSGVSPEQDQGDCDSSADLLVTDSGPGPITDVDVDSDSDSDLDSDADADEEKDAGDGAPASSPSSEEPDESTCEEKSKITLGQRHFLELFDAQSFHNRTQAEAVQALEGAHGIDCLIEAARWAAKKGLSLGQAVVAVETALRNEGRKGGRNPERSGRTGAPTLTAPGGDTAPGCSPAASPAEEVLPGVTREQMDAKLARLERTGGGERAPPAEDV